MSYPLLTRLGLSQFWYKHWCTTSKTAFRENVQQDIVLESLIELYLSYGFTSTQNPYFCEYWFYKNERISKGARVTNHNLNLSKFYRRFYYSNDVLTIEHSFLIRHVTGEHFPLRVWILKYFGWVILSFKCFKPNKSRPISARHTIRKIQSKPAISTGIGRYKAAPLELRRLKLLIFFLKNQLYFFERTYHF